MNWLVRHQPPCLVAEDLAALFAHRPGGYLSISRGRNMLSPARFLLQSLQHKGHNVQTQMFRFVYPNKVVLSVCYLYCSSIRWPI